MRGNTQTIAKGGLFTALIMLCTGLLKLPAWGGSGYVHLGDGMIFFTAMQIGSLSPWAAGLGSALADVLAGYAIYAIPTFVIKAMMGYFVLKLHSNIKKERNIAVFAGAELIMIIGYGLFEMLFFDFTVAIAGVIPNLIQGVAGIAIGLALCIVYEGLDKVSKKIIHR